MNNLIHADIFANLKFNHIMVRVKIDLIIIDFTFTHPQFDVLIFYELFENFSFLFLFVNIIISSLLYIL
jgi:hypothetical protein